MKSEYYFFLSIGIGLIGSLASYQIIFAFLPNLITLNHVPFLPEFLGAVIGSGLSFILSLYILKIDQRAKINEQKIQDENNKKNAKILISNEIKIKFNAIKVFEFALQSEANNMKDFETLQNNLSQLNEYNDLFNKPNSLETIKHDYSKLFLEIGNALNNLHFDLINAFIANKIFFLLDSEFRLQVQCLQNEIQSTATKFIDLGIKCSKIDSQLKDVPITNKILIKYSSSFAEQGYLLFDNLLNSFEDVFKINKK